MQSSSQIITTNKPTSSFFTGQMPFLLPNQQCQSTEGKNNADLLTPSSPEGLPTLSLTINSSGLPRGRVDMPLVSPLMPVPQLLWLKARFAPRKSSIAALNRSATAVPWPELNKCSKLSHSTAVRFSEHFPQFSSLRHCPFVRCYFSGAHSSLVVTCVQPTPCC